MKSYSWPGNVRELRNIVERIVTLHGNADVIRFEHLPSELRWGTGGHSAIRCPFVLPEDGVNLDEIEAGLLLQALDRVDGNQTRAAKLLGITRYALRYRLEKHGLKESS